MKFVDAYILARTKRKTRRIRTALVVIVSSLLFAVLFLVAFVAQGVIDAGKQVGDVGFNSRHLTAVYGGGVSDGFDYDAEIKSVERKMVAELKARGIKVDDLTKQDPSFQYEVGRRFNKIIAKQSFEKQQRTEKEIQSMGNLADIYHLASLPLSQFVHYQPKSTADPLVESIKKELSTGGGAKQQFDGPGGLSGMEFYSVESDMLRTQVHPGQSLAWQSGKPYPLVVSYNYLEKLDGTSLANLPATERNAGYRGLINRYAGKELSYCYRNSTAQDQLRSVMLYNKDAKEDDDDATKPLNVPVCRGFNQEILKELKIISEDDLTGTKPLFPLPKTPAPDTAIIKFKIAGFVPAVPEFGGRDVIVDMLVGISGLPTGPRGLSPKPF